MQEAEFKQIVGLLKIYPGCCKEPAQIAAWWETLKVYPFNTIYAAVQSYLRDETRYPTPAGILQRVPKASIGTRTEPRYESVNGEKVRVYACQRCTDNGLVIWDDEDGRPYGRVCNCPEGHKNYRWGWLTSEEQEEYVRKYGYHGEILGEDWSKNWND